MSASPERWSYHRIPAKFQTLVGFALLLGVLSCDAAEVTSPVARGPRSVPRATLSEPTELGVGEITPPATTSPSDVASIRLESLVSVPESTWVVVSVLGNVDFTWNPVCDQFPPGYFWGCETGSPTVGFSPVPGEQGPVRIWADEGGSGQWVKLRASGGAGGTPAAAVGLHFQAAAGQLSGEMSMVAKWAWNPTTGTGPYSYLARGRYTVTATAVPNPIRLTESEPDANGIRTYTAEPVAGLQFSNPLEWPFVWPAGAQFWYWVYGDSVSTDPNSGGFARELPECQFQSTCHYRPDAPGRMQLAAYVEGKAVRVRSVPAGGACQAAPGQLGSKSSARYSVSGAGCSTEPALILKCNESTDALTLTRGASIDCFPETDPPGTSVTVVGWKFQGDGDWVFPGPDDDPQTDSHWKGPMVMSGTITVTATVGTSPTPQSVSRRVAVNPRATAPDQPDLFSVRNGTFDDITEENRRRVPPNSEHDLGMIEFTHVSFGLEDPALAATFLGFVTEGPNSHIAYMTRVPARVTAVTAVNPEMKVGSEFYRKQAHFGQMVTPACIQESWARYITLILHHEGFPINDESHAGYYRKKLVEEAWPAVEDIVAPDNQLSGMVTLWQDRMERVYGDAHTYSDRVDSEHKVHFDCTFNF